MWSIITMVSRCPPYKDRVDPFQMAYFGLNNAGYQPIAVWDCPPSIVLSIFLLIDANRLSDVMGREDDTPSTPGI